MNNILKKRIFYISGLAANELAYSRLIKTPDFEWIFLPWIDCEKNEKFEDYVDRLIGKHQLKEDDIVMGLSFGGICAQQIAYKYKLKNCILICSFRSYKDLHFPTPVMLSTKLYKFLPEIKVPVIHPITAFWVGVHKKDGKEVFYKMLNQTDPKLVKWSIEQIHKIDLSDVNIPNRIAILGKKDRLVKTWEDDRNVYLEGEHMLLYEDADEFNQCLQEVLSKVD